jgi:flagellar motor switch protein FliG
MDQKESKEILSRIETNNPELGEQIRQLMFVFEDLIKVEARGIRELLERVDRKLLTMALKGTSEPLRNHFLSLMSQRAAEMLKEDMEALGQVRIKDVESAQQQIIATVRVLESEGVISLSDSSGDQYVS